MTTDRTTLAAAIALRKQTIKQLLAKRKSDIAACDAAAKQLVNARHASKLGSSEDDTSSEVTTLSTQVVQMRQTVQADSVLIRTDLHSDFTGISADRKVLAKDLKTLHSLIRASHQAKTTK